MKVIRADHAGFCFGVKRAMESALKAAGSDVYSLGPLIHNEHALRELEARGIRTISSIDDIQSGTVIIRAHGVPESTIRTAQDKGLKIIDATCPFVRKVQRIAKALEDSGLQVVIIGEKSHPEVIGIAGNLRKPVVVESIDDVKGLSGDLGVVCQTTQPYEDVIRIVDQLSRQPKVDFRNTICSATQERQSSASELAGKVDLMLVIGGKQSGNTRQLAQLCGRLVRTYCISSSEELRKEWFAGVDTVGITAGASTPESIIDEIEGWIHDQGKD